MKHLANVSGLVTASRTCFHQQLRSLATEYISEIEKTCDVGDDQPPLDPGHCFAANPQLLRYLILCQTRLSTLVGDRFTNRLGEVSVIIYSH